MTDTIEILQEAEARVRASQARLREAQEGGSLQDARDAAAVYSLASRAIKDLRGEIEGDHSSLIQSFNKQINDRPDDHKSPPDNPVDPGDDAGPGLATDRPAVP